MRISDVYQSAADAEDRWSDVYNTAAVVYRCRNSDADAFEQTANTLAQIGGAGKQGSSHVF